MKKFIFFFTLLLLVNTVSAAENASVMLHGEKTDVLLGEDIILKLSAVNIITKPTMTVQAILIPPSGMSVTSSQFITSGAGQFTSTFNLVAGAGKDIEVRIKTNQAGDFNVTGRVIYFFGDDKSTKEDFSLTLPIKVRALPVPTEIPLNGITPTPEYLKSRTNPWIFMGIVVFIFIFFVIHKFLKQRDKKAGIKEVHEIRDIIIYFLGLILIAYGLTGLFADSRDMGYISTLEDISPNFKELWFSLLTFCFGAFYGIAVIVACFDWKKRFQIVSILASSLIVAANFFHIITLRPWLFVIGLITFAYMTHIFRNKDGEDYIKYQVSTVTIAVISIIAVWISLLNYLFGRYDADTFIWYFILAAAFTLVFYKFSIYEISNLKLFIVGHGGAGKTVFVSGLYEEAHDQKRTIGDVSENLLEPLGILRAGNWPPANVGVKPYDFRFVHGNLFAKEVKIDIDYSGQTFEMYFDQIKEYLKAKKANSSILPEGDVEKIADGIYNADKLIFIIDSGRIKNKDGSGDYIKDYYAPILKELPGRTCYLLITKSDKLYGDKQIDKKYDEFKKHVISDVESKEPFYQDIKGRAKDVFPVFVYVQDDKPVKGKKLSTFGFDKVLDVIGK